LADVRFRSQDTILHFTRKILSCPRGNKLCLGRGAGHSWLATDRGLLEAAQLAGPWRRTSPPVGSSAVQVAAGGGDEDGTSLARPKRMSDLW
jgi:hypothetical protein